MGATGAHISRRLDHRLMPGRRHGPVATRQNHKPTSRRTAFRRDIEGPRAVAILLVVRYHVGNPGISGGHVGVELRRAYADPSGPPDLAPPAGA